MVGLIDIAPNTESVDVQGASVAVHGVSAKGVAHLLGRFPELRKLMTGQEVETEQLMAIGATRSPPLSPPVAAIPATNRPRQWRASFRSTRKLTFWPPSCG